MSTLNSVQVDHSVSVLCMPVGIKSEDTNCTIQTQVETMVHSKHMPQERVAYKPSVNLRMIIKWTAHLRKVLSWPAKFLLNQWIQTPQTLGDLRSVLYKRIRMENLFKEELKVQN